MEDYDVFNEMQELNSNIYALAEELEKSTVFIDLEILKNEDKVKMNYIKRMVSGQLNALNKNNNNENNIQQNDENIQENNDE